MRRGEVLGLRYHDLDLDGARLSVSQTVVEIGGTIAYSTPKTQKGSRSIALDPGTVEVLRAHRKRRLEECFALGLPLTELVFCHLEGEPLRPSVFTRIFTRIAQEAKLPVIRFHDLRHTHATIGLAAGVHPKVMQERLGHSTIAITLDIYSHVTQGHGRGGSRHDRCAGFRSVCWFCQRRALDQARPGRHYRRTGTEGPFPDQGQDDRSSSKSQQWRGGRMNDWERRLRDMLVRAAEQGRDERCSFCGGDGGDYNLAHCIEFGYGLDGEEGGTICFACACERISAA